MFDTLTQIAFTTVVIITTVWATIHALLHKRDPRSALLWINVCLIIPIIGPLVYWLLGINRITRRALNWQKTGRKPGFQKLYPDCVTRPVPLTSEFQSLANLEILTERVVKTCNFHGNQVTPLVNGEQAYPAMLEAIANAEQSIHLSSYIFDGDDIGAEFVRQLAEAASRGVTVRVIVDAMGERYSKPTARSALKDSGVDLRLYLPLYKGPFINLRNHRKLLVVDGRTAFTGGMNIRSNHCVGSVGLEKAASDIHFQVSGPVVGDLQRVFLEDWFFVSGERHKDHHYFPALTPTGTAFARVIADGPDRDFRRLEWIFMGALASARTRVCIMTPYFIPDRPMITALITAALRGVEITLILPQRNNLPFVAWASRASYWELIKNGIQVLEQPSPFAHTKLMLVDDLWSLIGSANLDPRSFRLNFELNLAVYDQQFSSSLRKHFEQVRTKSRTLTLKEMDSRPILIKLRDASARLFSPYL